MPVSEDPAQHTDDLHVGHITQTQAQLSCRLQAKQTSIWQIQTKDQSKCRPNMGNDARPDATRPVIVLDGADWKLLRCWEPCNPKFKILDCSSTGTHQRSGTSGACSPLPQPAQNVYHEAKLQGPKPEPDANMHNPGLSVLRVQGACPARPQHGDLIFPG